MFVMVSAKLCQLASSRKFQRVNLQRKYMAILQGVLVTSLLTIHAITAVILKILGSTYQNSSHDSINTSNVLKVNASQCITERLQNMFISLACSLRLQHSRVQNANDDQHSGHAMYFENVP